jgi:hypothetical protein
MMLAAPRIFAAIAGPAIAATLSLMLVFPPVAASAAVKKPAKEAPETAAKPEQVATYGDWGVYHSKGAKGRTCYTLATPKERLPADLKRDAAYAFISSRPGEGVRNEVSFIMGFDVATASAPDLDPKSKKKKSLLIAPTAAVGDASFEMLPKGANLWVKNPAMESQLIDEMRKGAKLAIKAASQKGNVTTDAYSLVGFTQAVDRMQKDCPSN